MQTLQQETVNALNAPGREFETRLDLVTWSGGTETVTATYGSEYITDWTIDESASSDGNVMIGAVTAAKLTINLNGGNMYKQSPQTFSFAQKQKMRLYLRAKLTADTYTEWIPLGAYYCDDVKRKNGAITVTAYDAMVLTDVTYTSTLTFPTGANAVIRDIADTIGFSYVLDDEKDFTIVEKPEDKTCREVLGQIASANLCNARLNREGTFVMQTILKQAPIMIDADQVLSFDFSDDVYGVSKIKVESKNQVYEYGSGTTAFSFKNELLNKVQRDEKMSNQTFADFYTGNCDLHGDLRIEPCDFLVISVPFMSDTRRYPVSVVDQQIYFNGGLKQSIKSSFRNDLQTETSPSQTVASDTAGGFNYAVFSTLPNVLPELADNTLVCELDDVAGDGAVNITDGQIGSNSEYTLYNLKNVFLYRKQTVYFGAHSGYVTQYTEAAQSMEEIILPTKARAWCGRQIRPEQDYEELLPLIGVSVGTSNIDYSYFASSFAAYNGLAKCKKLTVPDSGCSMTLVAFGNCPLLEEVVIYGDTIAGAGGCFEGCSSLHTVRFLKTIPNGYIPSLLAGTHVSEIYLPNNIGTDDNPYSSPITDNNMLAERVTVHTRGFKTLGAQSNNAFFMGGSIKEIVLAEGTRFLQAVSFTSMTSLECVTFPGNYEGYDYTFVGSAFEAATNSAGDDVSYPIFFDCPNLKKFRCKQRETSVISFAEANGIEVEFTD
jgi:hypothetical protein